MEARRVASPSACVAAADRSAPTRASVTAAALSVAIRDRRGEEADSIAKAANLRCLPQICYGKFIVHGINRPVLRTLTKGCRKLVDFAAAGDSLDAE